MPNYTNQTATVLMTVSFLLLGCMGESASKPSKSESSEAPFWEIDPPRPNVIVIFTDDQGYADLGAQGIVSDVKTPNIDSLAEGGVRFSSGYITSPQCTPSRAAMVTGQYQERFGLDENKYTPIPKDVLTLGDRFKELGYKTGMVGKWHLDISNSSLEWAAANHPEMSPFNFNNLPLEERQEYFPDSRGYDNVYFGFNVRFWRNFNMAGEDVEASYVNNWDYRLDVVSKAAVTFIDKNWEQPFYLHVAHYGPHVPLDATDSYLSRFTEDMPERRRYALAMISAIDDGVGQIVETLEKYQLLDNTIIYFISDNGAPLGDDMTDVPIDTAGEAWDGSMNTPYIGEKGMLTEGGIRVPYIMYWPSQIEGGKVVDKPVSSLDASYTALMMAGFEDISSVDGVNLMPALAGEDEYLDERSLFWRFYKQRAIRKGRWKYLQAGTTREYLFDMHSEVHESVNLIDTYPDIASELREEYFDWSSGMQREDETTDIEAPFGRRYDRYLPPN